MWTQEHRKAARRKGLRYDSDMTDEEWALVAPLIPPSKRGGRRRGVDVREILNAIFYVLWTGCQWKALPKDFPPRSTVHDYLMLWDWDGTLERTLKACDELVVADAGSGALTAISHINTAPSSASLSAAGGIAAPASLDITPNSRWVVAANHTGDVLRIDLSGAIAATKLQCSCAPNQVLALRGSTADSTSGTTVRLITAGGGPVWIVDAGAVTPRVMFIPAPLVPTTTTASAAVRPAL